MDINPTKVVYYEKDGLPKAKVHYAISIADFFNIFEEPTMQNKISNVNGYAAFELDAYDLEEFVNDYSDTYFSWRDVEFERSISEYYAVVRILSSERPFCCCDFKDAYRALAIMPPFEAKLAVFRVDLNKKPSEMCNTLMINVFYEKEISVEIRDIDVEEYLRIIDIQRGDPVFLAMRQYFIDKARNFKGKEMKE